jgi:putative Ca2+/H+ antiporter (TMEM165/GDT1 family)
MKILVFKFVNLSMVFPSFRGQALCTIAAVVGGKRLAAQISEKVVSRELESTDIFILYSRLWQAICDINFFFFILQVALSGGALFIVFGIQSFLLTVES